MFDVVDLLDGNENFMVSLESFLVFAYKMRSFASQRVGQPQGGEPNLAYLSAC